MAPRKPKLQVAIIVDPYGGLDRTGEDEITEHKADLDLILAPRKAAYTTPYGVDDATLNADLVVFDFGGMSLGNDLLGSNSRRLIRWAQDNSSSLVAIASDFTYRNGLLPELRELGIAIDGKADPFDVYERKITTKIHNIRTYQSFERTDVDAVRKWFQLKPLTDKAWHTILFREKHWEKSAKVEDDQ